MSQTQWPLDVQNQNNSGKVAMGSPTTETGGLSRLETMRAQLQQRQMQEKEQKLLQMLDSQQQRAMQKGNLSGVVPSKYSNGNLPPSTGNWTTNTSKSNTPYGGPSRASPSPMTGSIGPGGAGKVRQMFEDRRKGGIAIVPSSGGGYVSKHLAGIDKSYPLDPLDASKATMSRSGSSKSDPASHTYARGRGGAGAKTTLKKSPAPAPTPLQPSSRSKPLLPSRATPTPPPLVNSGGSKRGISLDRNLSSRSGSGSSATTSPTILSPIGKAPENGIGIRRSSSGFGIGKNRDENANDLINDTTQISIIPKTTKYRDYAEDLESRESALGTKLRQMSIGSVPSTSSSTKSPVHGTELNSKPTSRDTVNGKSSTSIRSKGTPPGKEKPTTSSSVKRTTPPAGLEECHICHRCFAPDRIAKHETICKKTTSKKRKVFDPTKMRMEGTEAEPYLRQVSAKPAKKEAPKQATKKADWRRKHEDFINTIRAAKVYTQHVAAGGNPADLPPPPPTDTSDYIQCPHCGRKFSAGAADRHIPKCQNIKSNKRR